MASLSGANVIWLENQTYTERMATAADHGGLGDLLRPHPKVRRKETAEDLIIQKAVAGRTKDWQDIEGILIEQRRQLDLDYLEDWMSQFAEALEQPEILAQYRDIQERIAAVLAQIQDDEEKR